MRARDAMTCLKLPQTTCVALELRSMTELQGVAMINKGGLGGNSGCRWAINVVDA